MSRPSPASGLEPSNVLYVAVRAVPGAARTAAVGMVGEAIKIRIAAAPEDGAANKALCAFMRHALHASVVTVASGAAGRGKLLKCVFPDAAPTLHEAITLLLHES